MNSTIKLLLSVVLIGGSLAYLVTDSLSDEIEYFHPADVVIVERDKLTGKRFRMGGFAKNVRQKKGTTSYWFQVAPIPQRMKYPQAEGQLVTVRFNGIVPDTFKEDNEVIVTGKLGEDGTFQATDLLAKCPSKYEAAEKEAGTY